MAKYSINIESKEPVDTVENVLVNVDWIKKAVADAGYSVDDYSFESIFSVGELSCTCDSEEELRVEALGQDIVFSNTTMNFTHDDDYIGFVISPSNGLEILHQDTLYPRAYADYSLASSSEWTLTELDEFLANYSFNEMK